MKTNKKKAIRMGLAVTAAALFWGGMYLLFGNDAAQKMEWNQVKDYAPDSEVCETLDEAVAETGNIPVVATATTQMLTAQVQQMNANYANAIGWIYVPDTHINYPIMQSEDNDFYLHHGADGGYLYAGSIFLDYRCNADFSGVSNILYGHNMSNRSMFADVINFTDRTYFDSHRYGWLTTENDVYCVCFFAVDVTENTGEIYNTDSSWRTVMSEAFVARMNQRAQELGCKNTHFANTTGLTQSGHYSSAYDLYLITREAIKHEDFMTMVNTKSYEIPPTNKTEEERVLHSTNALISNWRLAGYLYSGAQGIKTGSTDAAGQCLVSSAVRGSRTLISVVLGAEKVEKENGSGYIVESFTETARLFDWGFDNFAPQQVLDENELIQEVPVALSKQVSTVAVHPAESADAMLPKDLDVSALTRTVTLDNETALAPIAAGDRLGEITVSYGDTTYVTVPLLAVADVSASRFLSLRHAIGEFFSQRSARIAVLALVVLVAALVLWFRFYGRNRRYGKPGSKQYRHHSYRGRRH